MLDKASVLVIADRAPEGGLPEWLRTARVELALDLPTEDSKARDEVGALAAELLRYERLLDEREPRALVLLAKGDRGLAAALVATKLLIPVALVADGDDDEGLLDLLADRKLSADWREIAAWVRGLPTLP